MTEELAFGRDIFLKTDFPVALDSPDHYEEEKDGSTLFYGAPDADGFADLLMEKFPSHRTLIDLGTGCGRVPLSMRRKGLLAVGLEGSDCGRDLEVGCWTIMPEIIRSCDISRPFRIVDREGRDFKFDLVISHATFEHIHPDRMDTLWKNVKRLMHPSSVGMFNIDMGCSKYHLSGGVTRNEWQRRVEDNFELMRDLTFDDDGDFRDLPYYRPTEKDRTYTRKHGLPFHSGRTFWWVKLKQEDKMTDNEVLERVIDRAVRNGYRGNLPGCQECGLDWFATIFSHEFARAFWGDEHYLVGKERSPYLKEYLHHLMAMATYENPLRYLAKFFIELERVRHDDFVFGKDVFLRTRHPYAADSLDSWSPPHEPYVFHHKPVSLVSDFWDGEDMARALLRRFPGRTTLLDLGTATGSVPLTMRRAGMRALGVEGLPVREFELKGYMLKNPHLFCWDISPELLETCDITQPFRIEDGNGKQVKFDYIISTDCFEHLVTERLPILADNIRDHLADGGYGIFEINMVQWMGIHQTCRPEEWWRERFSGRFEICEDLSRMDFPYVRSDRKDGRLFCKDGSVDEAKILFWVRKK